MKGSELVVSLIRRRLVDEVQINVYELGATYLKLRSALHLTNPMPEVDPAIYNLRFAFKLDLGSHVNTVATDASRLVRRFKADWMTQGRRPAGVCGACLIIAARMSNYLRSPEEVAQVVKVSPTTIRKRLLEFAQTEVAKKTVVEWRSLSDKELLENNVGEDPPVLRQARAKAEAIRIDALQQVQEEVIAEAGEGDAGEGEVAPRKRRRKTRRETIDEDDELDDRTLEELAPVDYVEEMATVRDNPEEVSAQTKRDSQAFRHQHRELLEAAGDEDGEEPLELLTMDEDGKDDGNKEELYPDADDDLDITMDQETRIDFQAWNDRDATIDFLGKRYFAEEERLLQLTPGQVRERVKAWLMDREPREVVNEIEIIRKARRRREMNARARAEECFPDINDDELEACYHMDDEDVKARARLWLSQNGKWLEEDKGETGSFRSVTLTSRT